jgi:uncharacterized protein YbaR (Trm112 family)
MRGEGRGRATLASPSSLLAPRSSPLLMFIELTEALRCPRDHEESYLVCAPAQMDGRRVVHGILGCPVCHAEFPIVDGVAHFGAHSGTAAQRHGGTAAPRHSGTAPPPVGLTAEAVQTFLDLHGPGGYVLVVGSAGRLGPRLAELLERVHVAGVNPPQGAVPTAGWSVLRSPEGLPVKRHSMRAVVVGRDASEGPWLAAALGTLLPGLRAVIEDQDANPAGLVELARGAGVLVGERRAR